MSEIFGGRGEGGKRAVATSKRAPKAKKKTSLLALRTPVVGQKKRVSLFLRLGRELTEDQGRGVAANSH